MWLSIDKSLEACQPLDTRSPAPSFGIDRSSAFDNYTSITFQLRGRGATEEKEKTQPLPRVSETWNMLIFQAPTCSNITLLLLLHCKKKRGREKERGRKEKRKNGQLSLKSCCKAFERKYICNWMPNAYASSTMKLCNCQEKHLIHARRAFKRWTIYERVRNEYRFRVFHAYVREMFTPRFCYTISKRVLTRRS